jgi:hypothetical protein
MRRMKRKRMRIKSAWEATMIFRLRSTKFRIYSSEKRTLMSRNRDATCLIHTWRRKRRRVKKLLEGMGLQYNSSLK